MDINNAGVESGVSSVMRQNRNAISAKVLAGSATRIQVSPPC
jgi:hypothetical protein